jgi:hypothetical protein
MQVASRQRWVWFTERLPPNPFRIRANPLQLVLPTTYMEPEQQQPDAVAQPEPQPVAQVEDAKPEKQPEEPSDAGGDSEDEDEGDRRSSKRARKTVERMTIAAPVASANARAVGAEGGGVQLGEIEATNHHISSLPSKHGLLMALHKLLCECNHTCMRVDAVSQLRVCASCGSS